jgi:hypothetical protein
VQVAENTEDTSRRESCQLRWQLSIIQMFTQDSCFDLSSGGSTGSQIIRCLWPVTNTVEPLITDTAGEFKFCPL